MPKELVYRLGKGYPYHNLGRTKKDIVSKWSAADSEIEEILNAAKKNADKVAEISRQKDHRSLILLAHEGGLGEAADDTSAPMASIVLKVS